MIWLSIRILLSLVAIAIGLWLAIHEGKKRRKRAIGLLIIVLGVLQSADALISVGERAVAYFASQRDTRIHDVLLSPDRQAVEAFNKHGEPLWRRVVAGEIGQVILRDLEIDGDPEVTIGITGDDKDTGSIIVFDRWGERKWAFAGHSQSPYGGGRSSRSVVRDLAVDALRQDGEMNVLALLHDRNWFPSRAVLLDARGQLLGQYWNPGHLYQIRIAAKQDGGKLIIIAGHNNNLRATGLGDGSDKNFRVVLALDPEAINGAAPPNILRLRAGSQLWYLAVLPQGENISQLEVVDRNVDQVPEIGIWLECGVIYYVSLDGETVGMGRGDNATCDPSRTRLVRIN